MNAHRFRFSTREDYHRAEGIYCPSKSRCRHFTILTTFEFNYVIAPFSTKPFPSKRNCNTHVNRTGPERVLNILEKKNKTLFRKSFYECNTLSFLVFAFFLIIAKRFYGHENNLFYGFGIANRNRIKNDHRILRVGY